MNTKGNTTYAVVDVANMFSRARHITKGDNAYEKAGMALHIFFRSLRRAWRDFGATHMVVCLDGGSWRDRVFPQYKAARKLDRAARTPAEREEDEVFYSVLDDLVTYLRDRTRVTVLGTKGIEADDFVARWIDRHSDARHIILSTDSDFVQLLAPNVTIYDGVNERTITTDGVTGPRGERMKFEVNKANGRIKVDDKQIAPPDFAPEPEWWRKALFVKIIRGDEGDSIFSAYPGVRYTSKSKPGICEAWEDRTTRGYHWNNFFQQEWEKLVGADRSGQPIKKRVRVLDEYRANELLIDLTKQPEDVKALMDTIIDEALAKPPAQGVGIHFLRFCDQQRLPMLAKEANDHAVYLNAGYPK